MYARSMHEWERQRKRLDTEFGELISRVDYLADEVCFPTSISAPTLLIE